MDATPYSMPNIVHQSPTTSPTTHIIMVDGNILIIIIHTAPNTTTASFPAVIERAVRANELGKFVLMMSVPMVIGMFTIINFMAGATAPMHVAAVLLSLGFVGIWNGILLREVMDRTSNLLEVVGIAFVLLSFFGFIACFLPLNLCWIPLLCWTLSISVFLAAAFRSILGAQSHGAAAPPPPAPPPQESSCLPV